MSKIKSVLYWTLISALFVAGLFLIFSDGGEDTQQRIQARQQAWETRPETSTTTSTLLTTTTVAPTTTTVAEEPAASTTPSTTSTTPATSTTSTSTTTTTTTVPLPEPPPIDQIEVDGAPFAVIRIPRLAEHWQQEFDVDRLTVVRGDVTETADFPMKEALDDGPAWQDSSRFADEANTIPARDIGLAGNPGTFVIGAHRGGSDQDGEFGPLHTMEVDDDIFVETDWGMYRYRVIEQPYSVDYADFGDQLRQRNDDPVGNLLLFSCDEGTSKRTIVRAELASVNGIEV